MKSWPLAFVEDHLPPIGRDEQPRLAAAIADDVGLAVAGKIARDGRVGVQALVDDVLFPGVGGGNVASRNDSTQETRQNDCEEGFHVAAPIWIRLGRRRTLFEFRRRSASRDVSRRDTGR